MKRNFLTMFVMMAMLLISGCSHDEIVSSSVGSEVAVTFTTELRNDVKSRAVGDDAHQINQVMFAVYGEGGEGATGHLSALNKTVAPRNGDETNGEDPNKMYATIEVVLVKGQTYDFVFWAQTGTGNGYTSPYTFDAANATVSIDYQNANDKNADAFYAKIKDFTVTGTFQHKVDLRRPFAQVNFLTTDYDLNEAKNAGFIPSTSSIVVKNAATSLNLLEGTVIGNQEVTFGKASLIEDETVTIKNANNKYVSCNNNGEFGEVDDVASAEKFHYLATAYFLPSESSITASMSVAGNTSKTIDLNVAGVNAQKNFRTNIYGNLLTSNGQFHIVVNPDSDGNHNVSSEEFTTIYTSLEKTMIENKDNTDALTYNIQAGTGSLSTVSITIPEGTAAASLTFNLKDLATNAPITISNEGSGNYTNPVIIKVPENADLGTITINLPGAHVTLKQGDYEQVISSTSNTTLVVTSGTKIGTLTVKKGNVRIEDGAVVTTIKRDSENSDAITYVIYEGTLPTEANTDAMIVYVSAAEFELFSAATYGGEVKLTSNVELSKQLVVTANATIDLNGYAISQTKECTAHYEMIKNEGTLTIKGNGTIRFQDTGARDSSFGWGSYTIGNYGTLVVENGTIENLSEQNATENGVVHMYCAIQQGGGTTTINDGVVSTPTYRSLRVNRGTATINGGHMNGQVWMQPFEEGTGITINGGEFNPNGVDGSSVYIENSSKDVSLLVTGGLFNTKIGCANVEKLNGVITGGIFTETAKENTSENLLAEGYIFQENSDGTFTVIWTSDVIVTPDNLTSINFAQSKTFKLKGDFSSITSIDITPTEGVEAIIDASGATFGTQIKFQIPSVPDNANVVSRENARKGNYTLAGIKNTTLNIGAYGTNIAVTGSTLDCIDIYATNISLDINGNTIDSNYAMHPRTESGETDYAAYLMMMSYDLKFDNNIVKNAIGHAVAINGLVGTFDSDRSEITNTNWASKVVSFTSNTISGISGSTKDKRAGFKVWDDLTYAPNSVNTYEALPEAGQKLMDYVEHEDQKNTFTKAENTEYTAYKTCFYEVYHSELQ